MLNEELIEAYYKTDFTVFNPSICIKIDQENDLLNQLLREHNKESWAYITAFNPYSEVVSDEDNLQRHLKLKEAIKNYPFFEGEGVGEDPNWKPERSFLVIGISIEEATLLGKLYEQNAIVVGTLNSPAELLILV